MKKKQVFLVVVPLCLLIGYFLGIYVPPQKANSENYRKYEERGDATVRTQEATTKKVSSSNKGLSSSDVTASAIETVRAYLEASSWRKRLPYVLNPEKVKPLMEIYYGSAALKKTKFDIITDKEPVPTSAGFVKIEADVNDSVTDYYLKKTQDGYRVDWETSIGYNSVSTEEFRATKPTTPVRLRVEAKLDDYYNYDFSNCKYSHWSIALESNGANFGNGYVGKNTAMGQDLFKTLKDGNTHKMILEVKCPENAENGAFCHITKVIKIDGWLL